MNMETYIERIEAYLGGEMPDGERRRFEADLDADPELKSTLDLYRQSNQLIEWNIGENLRQQLRSWAKEEQPPKRTKVVSLRRWSMAVAAALALLISLWFVFDPMTPGNETAETLFAAYYEVPASSGVRSGGIQENIISAGLKLLNENEPEAALDYFSGLLENDPGNLEYRYYLGHANMLVKDWAAAEAAFSAAATAAAAPLAQKAEWNHALALLASGNKAALETRLDAIAANASHSFYEQAKVLKKQVRSLN